MPAHHHRRAARRTLPLRPDTAPILRMPCTTPDLAEQLEAWLRRQNVNVAGIEGREVLIPTRHPGLGHDIATAAILNGYADDDEAAHAALAFAQVVGARG